MPEEGETEEAPIYRIATLNIKNIETNLAYLHHLLEFVDIVCIQEHWLFNYEVPTVQELFKGYHYHIKCSDDEDPVSPVCRAKGNGGVLTIWKESVNHNVTPLQDGSTRCLVTQIGPNTSPVYIVNAYMPTEGSQVPYSEILDEVFEIMEKYRSR